MGLTKTTVGVTNISDLSSTPNATEGLTAAQLQAKFDKTGADLKTYINDTLTVEQDAINTELDNGIGDLSNLNTTNKDNLVNAINEVKQVVNENSRFFIQDLIQVGITSNPLNVTGVLGTLPFDTTTQKIGDNLSLVNNKIVVGGVGLSGKARLSITLYGLSSNEITTAYVYVYLNGSEIIDSNSSGGSSNRYLIVIDTIIDYHSGDIIDIRFGANASAQILTSYYRTKAYFELLTYNE